MNLRKLIIIGALFLYFLPLQTVRAQTDFYGFPPVDKPPIFCGNHESLSCPNEVMPIYDEIGESCATSYADFLTDPKTKHYWVEDPEITAQGKADERARQFLYWVLTTSAIDNAQILTDIWLYTAMIALFGVVLVAAVFGIGYIISQKTNYDFKIRVWPTIIKVGTMLLYVAFSASIVFALIEFSEILMRFSYERLGGRELFNIYFANPNNSNLLGGTEDSYRTFVGCRDLNIRVKEGIDAEVFMLKLTNVSYYVMGTMLLLRKILLWFLLFVSPFLALLMPFIFIRNTGWIWIGVFFQWLFYGPLLTLFLGGMAQIWKYGIPFSFDFSRVSEPGIFRPEGYVYTTGINIVYGGPAQRVDSVMGFNRPIAAGNNGSYVDTFAEYVITLIMLWAVTFFPWWLLRIFRDYCCDGIYAMKNILLAMYDNMRGGPSKGPSPSGPPARPTMKLDTDVPVKTDIRVSLGSLEQMKKSMTVDLAKNLNLSASRITDIARVETNKQMQSVVTQNLTYLANPVKAQRPNERQQYMNLRSELFARAIKNDSMARTIIASTSTSVSEKARIRESLIKSMPQTVTISQMVVNETHVPKEKVTNITNTYTKNITNNDQAIQAIAKSTSTPPQVVNNILNTYNKYSNHPVSKIVTTIAKENNTTVNTVKDVLRQAGTISSQAQILHQVATVEKLDRKQISKVLTSIRSSVTHEESTLQTISSTTQFPPPEVGQVVTQTFNSVASNEQLLEQIAPPSGQPPVIVKAVVQSFVKNMDQPASRIVEKISSETKTEQKAVSSILQETSKVLQTSSVIKDVAEKSKTSTGDVHTIISNAVEVATTSAEEKPTISAVVRTASKPARATTKTIQNVLNEISNNKITMQSVANQTNMQTEQVQNVMKSFANNINQASHTIVQKVAQETQIHENQVQQILQTVSQTVSNSKTEQTTIAKSAHVQNDTVEKISTTIGKTVEISKKSEQPAIEHVATVTSVENQAIQNVIQSFSQNTDLTTQVAEETHLQQSTVEHVLQSFSSHLDQSSTNLINTVASETNVTKEHAEQIIQSAATAVSNSAHYQEQITQVTNIPTQNIQQIAHSVTTLTASPDEAPVAETIITETSTAETLTEQDVTNVIQQFASNEQLINQVSQATQIDANTIKTTYESYAPHLTEAPAQLVQSVAEQTNLTTEQVQNVMQSTAEVVTNSPEIVSQISQATHISEQHIQKISNAVPQSVSPTSPKESLVKQVSQQSNITEQESQKIIHNLMMSAIENDTFVQNLAEQTQLKTQQIKNIMTTYANNINQPSENIVQTINESSGIPKASVQTVLITLADSIISSDQIIEKVAQEEGMEPQQVSDVMQKQMEVASEPEKHIEKTISIPQSISLEDYEEVKDMWTKHYEEGEVPVTETIKTRKDWVEQEIVYITNTLNKILSPDERIQQEGLDELGYLLPIFLINNLKGEELIVYLKAKLEAAKMIQKILEREESVKEKMQKEQEEDEVFVDVPQKEEEQKEMHMNLEEEQTPQSIEDRVKAVQEKLESVDTPAPTGDDATDSLNAIKSKLQEKADNEN